MNQVKSITLSINPDSGCDAENTECVDNLLKSINLHSKAFCNLESLTISNFADLTNCQALSSLKHFKCIDLCEHSINIASFANLETVEIEKVDWNGSCQLKNLPKLKSLTIENLRVDVEIDLNEIPNLQIIKVGEEEISIDRSQKIMHLSSNELADF